MSNLIFGHTHGGEQTNKETTEMLAARMQSSSKLDLRDSDITPLSEDRYGFNTAHYPQEVGMLGDGHYIKFHIFTNNKSQIEMEPNMSNVGLTPLFIANHETAAGMIGEETKKQIGDVGKAIEGGLRHLEKESLYNLGGSAVDSLSKVFTTKPSPELRAEYAKLFTEGPRDKFNTHTNKMSGAIVLYTPAETTFKYDVDYENADTGVLGTLFGTNNFLDTVTSAGLASLAELVTSALQIVSPGVGGLLSRATGMAINPNMELAFKAVPFRPFNFNFTFAPKNETELEQVHKIIRLFKFHMLPSLTLEQQFFISPSQFEMEYMYRDKNNIYIPKIARCVLRSMEVDYSPGEKFTTLKPDSQGASPQIIKLQLQFTEMAIITKETVANPGTY
jgi:hypothetical protein